MKTHFVRVKVWLTATFFMWVVGVELAGGKIFRIGTTNSQAIACLFTRKEAELLVPLLGNQYHAVAIINAPPNE